jgi:transcriptional antiterminator NusG
MGFSDQEEELTNSQETPDAGEHESAETSAAMGPSEPRLEFSPDEVESPAPEEGDLVDSSEAEISGSETETGDEAEIQEPATESAETSPVTESSLEKTGDDSDGLDLSFLDDDQTDVDESDEDGRSWYVVHCYSGYENKVRHNLEQRIETMGMKNMIFDIVVPTEEEIEVKEGKRRTVERRVFPGYILVNMIMTEESWYVVRNTPGVTGFVGMGNSPTPLRPEEVSQIIKRMEAEAPRIKVTFKSGERVRIVDGPFNDFRGTVSEIDMERAKVRVMVNFFGRETPVELDFLQVEKT